MMKLARDFRFEARNALRGKWFVAVIAGIIVNIICQTYDKGPEVKLEYNGGYDVGIHMLGQKVLSLQQGLMGVHNLYEHVFVYVGIAAIIAAIVFFILGCVVMVGYSQFNLNLTKGEKVELGLLFGYFSYWKNTVITQLVKNIYVFLWSLLLIIPGIIAGYKYAMVSYILAEYPEMEYKEVLQRSAAMMDGNKWRLFCLQFSFIGWDILASLTFGIGYLWLKPYKEAANAAFYQEVSKYIYR